MPRTTVRLPRIDSSKPSGVLNSLGLVRKRMWKGLVCLDYPFFVSYGHGIFLGIGPHQLYTLLVYLEALSIKDVEDKKWEQTGRADWYGLFVFCPVLKTDLIKVMSFFKLFFFFPPFFTYSWCGSMPKKILGFGATPQSL